MRTVTGAAFWIATSPFTVLGGNISEAGEVLVVKPFKYTFGSPLGKNKSAYQD